MSERVYRLRIDALTPDTLPMERLAEYMSDLAQILGSPAHVHFVRLEAGSTVLVQKIDADVEPEVRARARAARAGVGPSEAIRAYNNVNRRLLDDNASGILEDDANNNIIEFPGRKQAEPMTFGAFNQEGSLDGVVIRVGGVREQVPVTLQARDKRQTSCLATRELAKTLATFIFGPELRVYGNGRWHRDKLGNWNLERFTVGRFDVLGSEPLSAVVARMRDTPGNEWSDIADPWDTLHKDRGNNGLH